MCKQRGSLLIELSMVLVLLVLLSVGSVSWLVQRAEQQRVENTAVWMLRLQQGVQFFLDNHAEALTETQVPSIIGIRHVFKPTVLELKQLGFLPTSFFGAELSFIQLYREGVCPGIRCYVHAVIAHKAPFLLANGAVNLEAFKQWQSSTAAKGFVVTASRPDWLSGVDRQITNTKAVLDMPLPVGSVALTASTDPSLFGFVRQGDTRNPNFKTDVSIQGSIHTDADLISSGHLFFSRTEQKGAACNKPAAIAKGAAGFLICQNGIWGTFGEKEPSLGDIGGFYTMSVNKGNCNVGVAPLHNAINPITGSCGCPVGYRSHPIVYSANAMLYGNHVVTYVCLVF